MTYHSAPPRSRRPRRRRRLLLVLAAVLVVAAGSTTALLILDNQPAWHVAWHDDFDGSSVGSGWTVRNNSWAPNEESIDTSRPSNVSVADGKLTLTARRETRSADGTVRQFTSGYLDTIDHHSFRYGRFEIRARLPLSEGLWPAFWLRADHGLGEIDVLEGVGGMPRSVMQTVHQSTNGGQGKVGNVYQLPAGTIGDWHTYGVDVSHDAIVWTVDGHKTFSVTSRQAPWIVDTFDQALNIRLNLQVGGSLPSYYHHSVTADTVFPARYEIDWVRVYQFG